MKTSRGKITDEANGKLRTEFCLKAFASKYESKGANDDDQLRYETGRVDRSCREVPAVLHWVVV